MSSEPDEEAILEDVRADLADYQDRVGLFAFEVTEASLGRRIVDAYHRDGVLQQHEHMPVTFMEHRDWAHNTHGRPWFTAHVTVAEDGTCGFSFEYDLPPEAPELRTVGNIADDLDIYPRPAALVPGWMKVELALVGAWDLVSDQLMVNDRWEPVGSPQTAASVGVPLPVGAEHAWSEECSVEPRPGEAVASLRRRWQQLADEHAPLVRVLPPGAGVEPGTANVDVPPGLADVVDVLPGVALGEVVIDWPRAASQSWPELAERDTYQPVWANGREAIVVSVDPATGAIGEVVHVTGDSSGAVHVCGADVVSFLQALTTWAERTVPALLEELAPEAADKEELTMLVEEAVEQEFAAWLSDQH